MCWHRGWQPPELKRMTFICDIRDQHTPVSRGRMHPAEKRDCVDVVNYKQHLTNWSQVMHMCVNKLGYHWCWQRLVACSAPSHNLKQYLIIVNCNIGNKLQWHYCQNNQPSFCENAFRNAECKMLAFSSGPQYVKSRCQASLSRPVDEMACLKHANFDQIPIDQYFVTNDG